MLTLRRALAIALPILALFSIAFLLATAESPAAAMFPPEPPAAQPQGPDPIAQHPYDINDDGCDDLAVHQVGSPGALYFFPGTCQPNVVTSYIIPAQYEFHDAWLFADIFLLPGDLDKDGCADILARHPGAGRLSLWKGDCFFNFTYVEDYGGWEDFDWLIAPGDWDANGCPDVVGRRPNGNLVLHQMICGPGGGNYYIINEGFGSGWSGFDWLFGPQHWDSDVAANRYCGDIIGRSAADDDLYFYDGNCGTGFANAGAVVGYSWQGFDWIMSGGNWDNDSFGCPDVIGRSKTDGKLLLYGGRCNGQFEAGAPSEVASHIDWTGFDYFAGDAGPPFDPYGTATPTSSASASPTPTGTQTATPTPTRTPTPTPTATPTPTTTASVVPTTPPPTTTPGSPTVTPSGTDVQGDTTCNGVIEADDLQLLLDYVGEIVQSFGCTLENGDTDCDEVVDAVDALPILFYLAELPENQPPGCTPVGDILSVPSFTPVTPTP